MKRAPGNVLNIYFLSVLCLNCVFIFFEYNLVVSSSIENNDCAFKLLISITLASNHHDWRAIKDTFYLLSFYMKFSRRFDSRVIIICCF